MKKLNGKELADTDRITKLFSEFGFRNMTEKISQLFDIDLVNDEVEEEKVDSEELARAAILLWLLESERTNATYTDIIEYGRAF